MVVYQAPDLKVPYHYANLVRLWLGSVVIRPAKKVRSRGFPSGPLENLQIEALPLSESLVFSYNYHCGGL